MEVAMVSSMIETLEGRQLLSGSSCAVDAPAEAGPVAKAAVAVAATRIPAAKIVGNYAGSVKITLPFPYGPLKATLTILTVNATTKKVTGSIKIPKLYNQAVNFSVKSEFNTTTGAFVIRFSKGVPATGQGISATIKGTFNRTTNAMSGRFTGVVPYQGNAITADGTFTFKKVVG
jgi:hypothetical protein